jgi:hypothetical protein
VATLGEALFVSYADAVNQGIDASIKAAMAKACHAARNQIVKNLSGKRSGIVYLVPGTESHYTASAAGEYPAVATGLLKQTILTGYSVEGEDVVGIVGTTLDYGLYLEKKSPWHGGREWLRPSLTEATPAILAALGDPWQIQRLQQEADFDYGSAGGAADWGE